MEELCGTELTMLSVELAVEEDCGADELSALVLLTELLCTGVASELVCTELVVGVGLFSDSVEEQPETNVIEQSSANESIIEICFFEVGVIKFSFDVMFTVLIVSQSRRFVNINRLFVTYL